jgi:uncharacterized protein YgiM (DUF1202 family)
LRALPRAGALGPQQPPIRRPCVDFMRATLRIAQAVVLIVCLSAPAEGQTVTVTRNVNLRSDPSILNDPILLLRAPERLTLARRDRDEGYYFVRAADGQEGYVWAKNVRIEGAAPQEPGETAVAPLSLEGLAVLPMPPSCPMPNSTRSRWEQKTRDRPANATELPLTVSQMIRWAGPVQPAFVGPDVQRSDRP